MAASPVRTAAIPATLAWPHAWLLGPPVSVSFVSFLLQWTELDKDKMELAQVCTKVPRYCPVPQQFKGRALEKVKSRRTTKKKKHGPVVLAQAQQKARQTQEAEAASCRRALDPPPPLPSILYSVHTAPIFSHTKPAGRCAVYVVRYRMEKRCCMNNTCTRAELV